MGENPEPILDRRRFLRYGGAAGAVTLAGYQGEDGTLDTDTPTDDDSDDEPVDEIAEMFELDGITGGWVGIAPEEIADETNRTLELEAGETYRVV